MFEKLRGRFTYANVVATLALVIAVGGASAFAATKLAKNSVGTKQIKKNAVTSAKVKNQTLTGKDINLAKLGKVPQAQVADTANAVPPAEPIHIVGAPGEPPFENGSANFAAPGFSFQPVGFYKDVGGIVHLVGIAKAGPNFEASFVGPIFTLPPGYRPAPGVTELFGGGQGSVIGGAGASLSGHDVSGQVLGEEGELSILSGDSFRAGS
jgi:hypothetical protein